MQRYFQIVILLLLVAVGYADSNLELFPLSRYSQNVDLWLNPQDPEYNYNLLNYSYQQERLLELKHNYFGTDKNDNSPWSSQYIQFILNEQAHEPIIANAISDTLDDFDNNQQPEELIKFSTNYRPYSNKWIKSIKANINLAVFNNLKYLATNRAIASANLLLRALPTLDPAYHNFKIAGEGYPFDNLQVSAIYAGTPLYILGASIDKEWLLVLAPEYIGWVHADGVARVDDSFIKQ
ncbi:MAG: SH3 domain-containing protein [Burkholderiales bacterium]|nr:SH3 domain-containing protein [Burkholderiales bacterium]